MKYSFAHDVQTPINTVEAKPRGTNKQYDLIPNFKKFPNLSELGRLGTIFI